ncbi:hypothetical protein LEN26_020876 [Aphanomyces euteiches]|nr:hypothetical protein LEN26_020876 [Aphanomyces euteiches]KAH9105658.1 hypothetical protein AeMF1_018590 [Aphanomyces euteiches]KAH9189509.1 hypothetical protein AeNC1_008518 [Aphanomyces euteiches]
MSLAFLAKKSWHTSNLSNVEKVWKAEQKAALEEKKLAEWKKNIEEERQLKELRELQAKATGKPANAVERVDWMYEGPMAGSQREKTAEEYLLGKEYQEKPDENVLKQLSSRPGALYMNAPKVNDSFSRLNEDPMMVIKKQQKSAQLNILKNPVKMKRIKDKVEEELKQHKAEKKAKKEAKKAKKESKKHRSDRGRRSISPDRAKEIIAHRDFDDNRHRIIKIVHENELSEITVQDANTEARQLTARRADAIEVSNDQEVDLREMPIHDDLAEVHLLINQQNTAIEALNVLEIKKKTRRAVQNAYAEALLPNGLHVVAMVVSNVREAALKETAVQDVNAEAHQERQERPVPLKGYGVLGADKARKCHDIDTTTLGPSRKFLEQAKEKRLREEAEKVERFKRARAVSDHVSKEDKAARLQAMLEDAQRRDQALDARLKKKHVENLDGEDSATQQNPEFLRVIHDAAYSNTKESMEERLQRNKHYIQRNADSKNFMQR